MGKKVLHLIAGLGLGGAETMLYQLLLHRKDPSLTHCVVSLGAESFYEDPIRKLGIELIILPFKKKPLYSLHRIRFLLASYDVLCCWMYYGNFIGELAFSPYRKDRSKKIIWNVRHSNFQRGYVKNTIRVINRICAVLSKRIDIIAYNGNMARIAHEDIGYCSEKSVVLDNGCDISTYYHIDDASSIVRKELGILKESIIVLSVSKDDPIKDIPTFIKAFSVIHKRYPNTIAIMCGKGVEKGNSRLEELWNESKLVIGKDIIPLGLRHDVPLLLSGSDLYVLHSAGEAFPNTLIQAMACEALCVATDVGDAKRILNDDLLISPPRDCNALANVMEHAMLLSEDSKEIKKHLNRKRVVEKYSIQAIVHEYEALYK